MPSLNPDQSWLQGFPPTAVAMVMAAGIVSIAAHRLNYDIAGWILLDINAAAYPALLAITLCRLLRCPRTVHADIVDHGRGPGFLTLVAATAVLGSQLSTFHFLPQALPWLLTTGLWFVVTYTFLAAMTIGQRKPGLHTGLNGTWPSSSRSTSSSAIQYTTRRANGPSYFHWACILQPPTPTLPPRIFPFSPTWPGSPS